MRGLWSRAGALPPGSPEAHKPGAGIFKGRPAKAGLYVFPSEANFLLFKRTDRGDGGELYESLLSRGILIRRCGDYQGLSGDHYRICVKKKEENRAFLENLGEIYKKR